MVAVKIKSNTQNIEHLTMSRFCKVRWRNATITNEGQDDLNAQQTLVVNKFSLMFSALAATVSYYFTSCTSGTIILIYIFYYHFIKLFEEDYLNTKPSATTSKSWRLDRLIRLKYQTFCSWGITFSLQW